MTQPIWLRVLITLFYSALAITAAVPGYYFVHEHLLFAEYSTSALINVLQFFVGTFVYLLANVIATGLLINNLCQEDVAAINDTKPGAVYSRQIFSGYLREKETQTNVDMVVTVIQPDNKNGSKHDVTTIYRASNGGKPSPELPLLCTFKNRSTSSSPALYFNSFNFDGNGVIMSCEKFQVSKTLCEITFKDLGGLGNLKNDLINRIIDPFAPIKGPTPSVLPKPRTVLIIGRAGIGKNSLVRAAFNLIQLRLTSKNVRLYKVDGTQCFGSFIGSGATFRDLFHYALEQSPFSVLHFDNIDQLNDRSVAILISELNSMPRGKMLVFATTSRKDKLHEGLRSFDRFDFVHEMALPLFWDRVGILRILFQRRGCSVDNQDLQALSKLTTGYIAIELEKLVSMVNITIVEEDQRAYFDIIKSLAKPFDLSGFNVKEYDDLIVTDDTDAEAVPLIRVPREKLLEAFQEYESIRMKKKPLTGGNNNNSVTSSTA